MTAIVTSVARSTEVARRHVSALLDALAFRGNERSERFADGAALGSVSDDNSGAWFGDDDVWVVADARLDNRAELIAKLGVSAEVGNAELLGRAHVEWPERWPEQILGDFAVAIWDRRARRLTLIRDPVGVRSLYFLHDEQGIRCASEMMALARTMSRINPDPVQLGLFLLNQYAERDRSLIQQLRVVPPAHVVVLDERGEVGRHRYWFSGGRVSDCRTPDDCADEFRAVLRRAVADRLRTNDQAVASEVSGGFDSTSVTALAAALAREAGSRPMLQGVTKVFPGLDCDETSFSRAVASHVGVPLLEVDPYDAPEYLKPSFSAHASGDVYYHPTLAMSWLQLHVTRARGIRHTLTGFGSDQLAHREPLAEAIDAIRGREFRGLRDAWNRPAVLVRALLDVSIGSRSSQSLRRALRPQATFLDRRLQRQVDEVLADRTEEIGGLPHRDETQLALASSIEFGLPTPLASVDRMTARVGSIRLHPFLDRRVIESVLAMPHALTSGRGREFMKPMLRRAMRGLLPRTVLQRRTITDFGSFVGRVLAECAVEFVQPTRRSLLLEYGLLAAGKIPSAPYSFWPLIQSVSLETWLRSLESGGNRNGRE